MIFREFAWENTNRSSNKNPPAEAGGKDMRNQRNFLVSPGRTQQVTPAYSHQTGMAEELGTNGPSTVKGGVGCRRSRVIRDGSVDLIMGEAVAAFSRQQEGLV